MASYAYGKGAKGGQQNAHSPSPGVIQWAGGGRGQAGRGQGYQQYGEMQQVQQMQQYHGFDDGYMPHPHSALPGGGYAGLPESQYAVPQHHHHHHRPDEDVLRFFSGYSIGQSGAEAPTQHNAGEMDWPAEGSEQPPQQYVPYQHSQYQEYGKGGRGGGKKGVKGKGAYQQYQQEQAQAQLPHATANLDDFPVLGSKEKKSADKTLTVVTRTPVGGVPQTAPAHSPPRTRPTAPPRAVMGITAKAAPSYANMVAHTAKKVQQAPRNVWYSRALYLHCKSAAGLAHITHIERTFREMITTRTASKMLPAMNRQKRGIVHELGLYYNMNVASVDREPKRSCNVKITSSAYVPRTVCSEWCRLSKDPNDIAEERLLSHPHLALVFPRVPAAATEADFNIHFSPQAGRVLMLYRKAKASGEGPVRVVLAVFLTDKAFASAKRSGRYDATDYATWEHREHGATEDAYEGPPPTACQREDADGDADNQDPAEDADREEGTAGDSIDALSPSSSVSNSNPRAKPHNTDWDVCERGPVVELHDPKISDFISTRNQFSSLKRSEVG